MTPAEFKQALTLADLGYEEFAERTALSLRQVQRYASKGAQPWVASWLSLYTHRRNLETQLAALLTENREQREHIRRLLAKAAGFEVIGGGTRHWIYRHTPQGATMDVTEYDTEEAAWRACCEILTQQDKDNPPE